MVEIICAALTASILTSVLFIVTLRKIGKQNEQLALDLETMKKNEAQHQIDKAKSNNAIEIDFLEKIKNTKNSSYKEGFDQGVIAERQKHELEIQRINLNHEEKINLARKQAEQNGYDKAKKEIGSISDKFHVDVRPYVNIEKDNGIIWDTFRTQVGYQHQLYIEGIPVFTPHVIIERTEEVSEVNKEHRDLLIKSAKELTLAFIQSQSRFALASSVIKVAPEAKVVESTKS